MKFPVSRLAALGILVLATACSTLKISTDYDPAVDFARYRTFTLKHGAASKNPLAVERLDTALEAAIVSRGLVRVADGGDLSIVSHFILDKETLVNTTTFGYYGWPGWKWGRAGMGSQSTSTVHEIPTGTVVVDVVDAKTGKAVWRGVAKDRISTSGTPEDYQQQAREAAFQLFAGFPPSRKNP
jgi:hypothetical protein